jgi:hypothetical protein
MTSDCKKPGVAFWATVVLTVSLLYVASLGPVVWLESRDHLPGWGSAVAETVYQPLTWIASHAPEPISDAMWWYAEFWRDSRQPEYLGNQSIEH